MKKNFIYLIIGVILLPISISFIAHANLGSDTFTAFLLSISFKFGIELGTAQIILNLTFLLIHFIKFRKITYTIFGVVISLFSGLVINFFTANILTNIDNTKLIIQLLLFVPAFLSLGLAIALVQKSHLLKFPYESFQAVLADIFKKDINFIRVFVEISFLILALIVFIFILKFNVSKILEYVGIGTVITMILTGPLVNLIYKKLLKERV